MPKTTPMAACAAAALLLAAPPLAAQGGSHAAHDHPAHGAAAGAAAPAAPVRPTMPGQDAYGAIAEVVRILEADSATDWSRVELEALRQHLIDMSEVTLRSVVVRREVAGGLQMDVTGDGRTATAIRTMTAAHAAQLAPLGMSARSEPIPGGARVTVTARDPGDARLVAKIRGLGFIGLMALGDHHAAHHLAIARGGGAEAHAGH